MTKEELWEYVQTGREIEWKCNNKEFSITYCETDEKIPYISFCESHQEPIDVFTFDELINIKCCNTTVLEVLKSLKDDEPWIS